MANRPRPDACAAATNIWESKYFPSVYPLPTIEAVEPEDVCGVVYERERCAVEVMAQFPGQMAKLKQAAARLKTVWRGLVSGGTACAVIAATDSLSLLPAGFRLAQALSQVVAFTSVTLLVSFFWGWRSFAGNQRQQVDLILEKQRALATLGPDRPAGT